MPNSRRAILRSILAAGAVATVPAVAASAAALSPAGPSAVSSESEIVTLEEMATMKFEPWSHSQDEWSPLSDEEWAQAAPYLLPHVRMAWLLMYKTRAELEAAVVRINDADNEGLFEDLVNNFVRVRKFFEDFVTVLNAAECRVVCAASTVCCAEGPDEGEA